MAKLADFETYLKDKSKEAGKATAGALLKTAMSGGSLEDYGVAVVSAVMDSYVPGLSSAFSQREVLNEIEVQAKTAGSAGDLAPFPYVSLIEVYTEVMQLYLLTNPNYILRAEANDQNVKSRPDYEAASPAVIQQIDTLTHAGTLAVMEATIEDALAFAKQLSDRDPYAARAAWMVSEPPVATWFEDVDCDEDTERVQEDAQWMLGLLLTEQPLRDLPDVVFSYSSKSMNPDYTTTEQRHCIVQDKQARGWWSTYDGFAKMYGSVDEAFEAHQEGTYNALLRVGWGPFGVTLDKWWQALRSAGLRSGLRPRLALDASLDDYLLHTGGDGVTTQSAMYIVGGNSDRAPTSQEAALLVGYAIEHGPDELYRLYTDSHANDWFFKNGGYPLDDRIRFVTNVRDPGQTTAYFRSVNAARILPLL